MSGGVPVIAIDGPVGSGKGTVSSRLAALLGWHFLDSGVLYRLTALRAMQKGIDPESEEALAAVAAGLDFEFRFDGERVQVLLSGEDVTLALRREAVSAMASRVAALSSVRAALLDRQRAFAEAPGLVADGRDMGTVVFPQADLKFFLTASARKRAERRYKQLKEKGESVNLSRLFRELEARDARDSTRDVAPLKPAEDAIIIDSTDMDVEQVVQRLYKIVEESILKE